MPRNLLLIHSDPIGAKRVRGALVSPPHQFAVEWVTTCGEGLQRIRDNSKGSVAAILVDLVLSDSKLEDTFERVLVAAPHLPILVLCDGASEEVAKLAVEQGAQDYLLKSRLDDYVLPKTVRTLLARAAAGDKQFDARERARVTLDAIGDAVLSCDALGVVTYLNAVAEQMTGWLDGEAVGRPIDTVLRIIDGTTLHPIANPIWRALTENKSVGLTQNCVIVRRDCSELAIEDSAAPIHDRRGVVTGAVMVFRDVSAARAMSIRMAFLAQHDSLTELPNRMLLMDRLAQAITSAHRNRRKVAVIYLDVDRFKNINDSMGHDVGDHLLRLVGQRLRECVRESDTVSRQGGDEFVILLADLAYQRDAVVIADKILSVLQAPFGMDERELRLSASLGIVTYPKDGEDAMTLLKNADIAMYHAKGSGRNKYRLFQPQMNLRLVERRQVEDDLQLAVARGEFILHYQPKIDLETGTIVGAEALLRWQHPERGLLAPAQFMSVAEESGLIVPIGHWVLREGCRQARAWQTESGPAVPVAINVSVVELGARGFAAGVRAILTETGLTPNCLELELTETFLTEDPSSTPTVLRDLKGMGIRLALDDFGTGYSSLSFLKRFPIDTVKIDRSFVRDIATDADDASIVSAVIGMAERLHMQVVAEGVETSEQLDFLRAEHCPQGQGYYFSKPLDRESFTHTLKHFLDS